ncbi:protein kinase domain-containing protein [Ramlibacter albus]|uniref:non-specific serine/threonine protein kinase n=1 Tax=Ramlibacter albus TaxID=2079448 RepID=A0A923S4C6_9BURK|nr:protein kinase [Ramlibacter albus]MBC5767360.1 protein kinase [Ramlibacter albus]
MPEAVTQIGKYRVERELGRGGMGVVYAAMDPVIERRVALKTISRSLLEASEAEAMLARFKREAQAAGRLTHPGIVAVYDYGEEGDLAYIAMELVSGRGLQELMRAGEPMDPQHVRPIAAQLLAALHFAHGLGVVHRDIKPSNVMITDDQRLKVCDFGIAQLESSRLTQVGTVLGTPSYMSPEQIQGLATDRRSDVFSAAVLLYQLLTGRKPFAGDTVPQLVHAVLHGELAPPTTVNPALDVAFDAVMKMALARHPNDRFDSANDFARALECAFAGEAWNPGYETTVQIGGVAPFAATQAIAASEAPTRTLRKIDFTSVRRPAGATQVGTATAADKPRVLFVDDEERILSALKLLFRQQYDVHVTTEGAIALQMMQQHHFHVIVSDQRMPTMTGTELLSKARVASPNTVRILLTGYSDLAAIVGSVNEGEVYRFASKPWNTNELRDLLAEAAVIGQTLEHAPPPAATDARPEEAILVLDEDREVYLAARDVLGRSYRVLHATDLAGALQSLRDEKVAVLVADIETQAQSHTTFFKLLKQEHPEIVTVAMTSASDSEVVIELINQARIFRFLNKPVKLPTLQSHVEAAMAQYQRQKAQPQLLRHQQVEAKARKVQHDEGSVGGFILGSLRALRRRLAA